MKNSVKCQFCNKPRSEVHKMLVTNEQSICDACVQQFHGLLNTPTEEKPANKNSFNNLDSIKMKSFLDQYVIGQDSAKMALCVGVVNHYKRMLYESETALSKSNLLITGPSGSGKSLLMSTIARFLEIPFITVDATSLTEAGFIGQNVDTIISRLVAEANGDLEAAEHGMVFIDEIDKIAMGKTSVSTRENRVSGVQSALLKMIEGSVIPISYADPKKSHFLRDVEVKTQNILFVCGGAFVGLDEIVKNRLKKKKGLGFTNEAITITNIENEYTTEDFIEFGMIPEFIGRFSVKTFTKELLESELQTVMREAKNNMLDEYKFYFNVDNIEVAFTEDFLEHVAHKAKHDKTGVRGLRSICEGIMTPHLYLIPEYKKRKVAKMTFNQDCVKDKKNLPLIEVYAAKKRKIA